MNEILKQHNIIKYTFQGGVGWGGTPEMNLQTSETRHGNSREKIHNVFETVTKNNQKRK